MLLGAAQDSSAPGALFSGEVPQDEKPAVPSANEMWQRMHSDPLLLIKQQEQQALSRIRSNPVQMAMIRKEVWATQGRRALLAGSSRGCAEGDLALELLWGAFEDPYTSGGLP